jgi:hypothetical protein
MLDIPNLTKPYCKGTLLDSLLGQVPPHSLPAARVRDHRKGGVIQRPAILKAAERCVSILVMTWLRDGLAGREGGFGVSNERRWRVLVSVRARGVQWRRVGDAPK